MPKSSTMIYENSTQSLSCISISECLKICRCAHPACE